MTNLVVEYTTFRTGPSLIDPDGRAGGCVHYFKVTGPALVDVKIPEVAVSAVQAALILNGVVGVSNTHGLTYTLPAALTHDDVINLVSDVLGGQDVFGPDAVITIRAVDSARVGAHAA